MTLNQYKWLVLNPQYESHINNFIGNDYSGTIHGQDTQLALLNKIQDCDALLFLGGSDINPQIYHHEPLSTPPKPNSPREIHEITCWKLAQQLGKPSVGICRGAQLLWALSGGILWQDLQGHSGNIKHKCSLILPNDTPLEILINSEHHQGLAFPVNIKFNPIIIGKSDQGNNFLSGKALFASQENANIKHNDPIIVPEIAWNPTTNCFMIQGHPEWMSPKSDYYRLCAALIEHYVFLNSNWC